MAGGDRKKADAVILGALVGGATVEDTARRAGVSESTVYRRLQDADFVARLDAARADTIARTVNALSLASYAAVTTLAQLLQPTVPPAVRLGAARAVLELGPKWREVEDLERRIVALEQRAPAQQQGARQNGVSRWAS